MDTDALGKILLPISPDEAVCHYVAALALAIADKEQAIRVRNNEIHRRIEDELTTNQRNEVFRYENTTLQEVRAQGRFDAAIYSQEYKSKIWRVQNYRYGHITPSAAGFTITPGPSLEIKLLLTRIDSDTPKPGFYKLLIPPTSPNMGRWKEFLG